MSNSLKRFGCVACGVWLALGILFLLPGCAAYYAATNLDRVAQSVDKYGFASISAPFLASPSDNFNFDLDKDANYFFEQAFVAQGGVRNFSAEAVDLQMAFRVNIEQALATIAQFQRARSINQFNEAQRKAGVQKALLKKLVEVNSSGSPIAQNISGNVWHRFSS